ncbi:MAG: ferredoxin [Patescibacteria group bacterium]|nr:ferredoxin [Patescibacteria group bacterium]
MPDRKLKIDKELCIGCGLCTVIAGKTFELGEDGKAVIADPQGNSEDEIQEAINSCPVSAISW